MYIDNLEEYQDPDLYDWENETVYELPFLAKWAARSKGPIIDLACGTGRTAIPLVEKGFEIIGVDIHSGMLEQAKKKASKKGYLIKWVFQDCRNLYLDVQSSMIYMVGNSFQHFLTNEDQNKLMKSVHRHLRDDGVFIFNSRFPNAEELLQPPAEEYWRSYINYNTKQEVDVYTVSSFDLLSQIQHYETIRRYKNSAGKYLNENRTNIRLRYSFPKEMERLLTEQGLKIIELYGDWNETPISQGSSEMIYVCQKY
ncbi:class I SAM-dependent methyltransferase [Bacillus sp. J33]|uniref:class I SAM-dependent methyltransferase n=1 Tax=Bacillus sp. J33 TaxID=935836 RepID=UPI00047C6509|nr:class I SAM-dependent methyltransferase [Bacillus sp. J33]